MQRFIRQAKAILIYSWQDFLSYRGYLVFWIVVESMSFFAMYYLWIFIYQGQNIIATFDLRAMITYYFVAYFVREFTDTYYDWNMIIKVNNGKFAQYLYRPMTHKMYYFFSNMGEKAIRLFMTLPIVIVLMLLVREYFVVASIKNLLLMVPAVAIAALLNIWICFIVGTIAFWTEKAESFIYFKHALIYYLSGAMIPLVFFGPTLSGVMKLLPFRYMVSFPVEIYLGRVSAPEIWSGMAVGTLWVCFMIVFEKFALKYGLSRYTAVGN